MTDVTIRPFRIEVPQADVEDLKARLLRTRWPDEAADAGWDYGLPLGYAKELVDYWTTGYDWRVHEAALNAIPQFVTTVDSADVHFLHIRSARPDATPLLLIHGWPGSVLEFVGLVGPLTDPPVGSPPYDVVIPSIPGFGPAGPTRDRGWTVSRIAAAFVELMSRLGYRQFGAHGGDWGAFITREIAVTVPDMLVGAHLTMLPSAVAHPGAELEPFLTRPRRDPGLGRTFRADASQRARLRHRAEHQTADARVRPH